MVFLSIARWSRRLRHLDVGPNRGPDEYYRKRNIFRLSAHFFGRARNCYSIALRRVHRSLVYATKGRKLKREDMRDMWTTRITGGCEELGITFNTLRKGLTNSNILLNRKSLADLAIWEPRSFKALTEIAWSRAAEDGLNDVEKLRSDPPDHVITRGMLRKKK